MTSPRKRPPIPSQRQATLRRQITALLSDTPLSARDISTRIGISEKEVFRHLEHIQHSLRAEGRQLRLIPSVCKKCGFVFQKRERLRKPGKCPVCRGEAIEEPRFAVK